MPEKEKEVKEELKVEIPVEEIEFYKEEEKE